MTVTEARLDHLAIARRFAAAIGPTALHLLSVENAGVQW